MPWKPWQEMGFPILGGGNLHQSFNWCASLRRHRQKASCSACSWVSLVWASTGYQPRLVRPLPVNVASMGSWTFAGQGFSLLCHALSMPQACGHECLPAPYCTCNFEAVHVPLIAVSHSMICQTLGLCIWRSWEHWDLRLLLASSQPFDKVVIALSPWRHYTSSPYLGMYQLYQLHYLQLRFDWMLGICHRRVQLQDARRKQHGLSACCCWRLKRNNHSLWE